MCLPIRAAPSILGFWGRSPPEKKIQHLMLGFVQVSTKVKFNTQNHSRSSQSFHEILLNRDPGLDLDLDFSHEICLTPVFCAYPPSEAVELLASERRVLVVPSELHLLCLDRPAYSWPLSRRNFPDTSWLAVPSVDST